MTRQYKILQSIQKKSLLFIIPLKFNKIPYHGGEETQYSDPLLYIFPNYFFWSLPFYRQTSLKACDAHRIKNNVEVSTLNSGGMLDIIYTMAKEIINCVRVA